MAAFIVLALGCITGCSTIPADSSPVSAVDLSDAATRPEAERQLGRPESMESYSGRELWVYDFEKTKDVPVTFVTYANLEGHGADRKTRRLVYFNPPHNPDESVKFHAIRSSITTEMIRALKPDMPVADISALLGRPASVTLHQGREIWQYDAYTTDFKMRVHLDLAFTAGKLTYYPILPDSFLSERIRVSPASPQIRASSNISLGKPVPPPPQTPSPAVRPAAQTPPAL